MPLAQGPGFVMPGDGSSVDPSTPSIGTYDPVWIAPDGTELPLNPATMTGYGHFSLKDVAGLGAVPVDVVTTPAPEGGTIVDYVRARERTIQWPLRIRGRTHTEFLLLWRYICELFTQTRRLGPGRLRITRQDGTAREILAVYQLGLEQGKGDGAWTEETATIGLYCPDPFWRAIAPTRKEWRQETPPDFLVPYPSIASGQIIGTATLVNNGHDDAWPTWTIRGPLTSLQATNVSRGESFTLTYPLGVGQALTMATRPLQVRGPGGVQAVGALNLLGGGIPWRLTARATTNIQFTAAGTANETGPGLDNGSMIAAEFTERFETA